MSKLLSLKEQRKKRLLELEHVHSNHSSKSELEEAIIVALDDEHDTIRSRAVEIAFTRFGKARIPQLVEQLKKDPFWSVRKRIVQILGHFSPDEEAFKGLSMALTDLKPKVRIEAISLLQEGAYDDEMTAPLFVKMMTEKDDAIRVKIFTVLRESTAQVAKDAIKEHEAKVKAKEEKMKKYAMFDGI